MAVELALGGDWYLESSRERSEAQRCAIKIEKKNRGIVLLREAVQIEDVDN